MQLTQSFTRWCCGTVRYAVTEETLLLSDIVRRFLGNVTFGWDELSVNTGWHMVGLIWITKTYSCRQSFLYF